MVLCWTIIEIVRFVLLLTSFDITISSFCIIHVHINFLNLALRIYEVNEQILSEYIYLILFSA